MKELCYVKAFAPSTVANLSVGFDLLGMSVPVLGDRVSVKKIDSKEVIIKSIIGDQGQLSKEVTLNTAGKPILSMLQAANVSFGIEIEIEKGIPLSSGLGGSAASAVAATVAMNRLLHEPFKEEQLLQFALEGEEIASGSRHSDNVAPALYGGLVACLQNGKIHKLTLPKDITCLLIHPDLEINTKDAREILKKEITHHEWIEQSSNLLGFMTGIANQDREVLFSNLNDCIITPQRKHLIAPFDTIAKIIEQHQGTALGISGAGPTMFSFFRDQSSAENASNSLSGYKTYISEVPGAGAFVELEQ